MTDTRLSMSDFTRYFDAKRLGHLYFPNGQAYAHPGYSPEITTFNVGLADLYKMICGWRVNHMMVPLEDIIAVIAFGSAVRCPEKVPYTRPKYFFFGEPVTRYKVSTIEPEDADFLIITTGNLMREEILEPISIETYDAGTWIKRGGIHVVNRGVSQFTGGLQAKDTISMSALREGVPIFFNERFTMMLDSIGIRTSSPRKLFWDENRLGQLFGMIR